MATHARKPDVQHHHVGPVGFGCFEDRGSVIDATDIVPGRAQDHRYAIRRIHVIVHDQDPLAESEPPLHDPDVLAAAFFLEMRTAGTGAAGSGHVELRLVAGERLGRAPQEGTGVFL
jgi:hypothetical protein